MKFLIIVYIALGLILCLAIGVEYTFTGNEMFPTYYGSPFVFKRSSLGSSMEYYYSISGLAVNMLVWSSVLFFIDKAIRTFISKIKKPKWILISYRTIIGLVMVFTTFTLTIESLMIAHGFKKGMNYWYWNMEQDAKDWGMSGHYKVLFFKY